MALAGLSFAIKGKRRRIETAASTDEAVKTAAAFVQEGDDDDGELAEVYDERIDHAGRFVFGQLLSLEDANTRSRRLQTEGITLAEAGRFRPAIGRWNEAIECTPDRAELHEMKAQALLQLGEYFDGIEAAERCVALLPGWPPGVLTLGRAQLGFGELDLALATFQRALAMPWPELKEELKEEEKLDPERRSELADEIAADIGFVTELITQRAEHAASLGKSAAVYSRAVGVTAATAPAPAGPLLSTRPEGTD